jgi:hypothetical protein
MEVSGDSATRLVLVKAEFIEIRARHVQIPFWLARAACIGGRCSRVATRFLQRLPRFKLLRTRRRVW